MTDRSTSMHDLQIAALFREGSAEAPRELLGRTMAATRPTRQRPSILALAAGAPSMRPWASSRGVSSRAAIALLLLLGLAVALVAVGRLPDDHRLIAPPTNSPTVPASPGPVRSAAPGSTVFRIPGSTVTFAAVLAHGWRLTNDNALTGDSVRIVTQYAISQSFDVSEVAWIVVRATTERLDEVQASMVADGWTGPATALDVPGLDGLLLTAQTGQALDPTALVPAGGVTYRISAHYTTAAGLGASLVKSFLASFTPLGVAPEGATYRDDAWDFAFLHDATPVEFLPGVEQGDGVTRFADASCDGATALGCDRYVEVIRRLNTSPLELALPGAGPVRIDMDPTSLDYVALAADLAAKLGQPEGSSTYEWQGSLVFDVQQVVSCTPAAATSHCDVLQARFVHRGDAWLIIVSSDRDDAAYNRLRAFVAGLSLLPRS